MTMTYDIHGHIDTNMWHYMSDQHKMTTVWGGSKSKTK